MGPRTYKSDEGSGKNFLGKYATGTALRTFTLKGAATHDDIINAINAEAARLGLRVLQDKDTIDNKTRHCATEALPGGATMLYTWHVYGFSENNDEVNLLGKFNALGGGNDCREPFFEPLDAVAPR